MADAPPRPRPTATAPTVDGARTIRPRRSLPGGRAVVGAFLVVVAAVGTFGAYLSATAAPTSSYVVADRPFELGHVVTADDLTGAAAGVRGTAIDLPEEVAARAYRSDPGSLQQLLGRVVVAPIAPGDLLLASQFADVATADDGAVLSLSLPTDRALAGRVGAGEQVDLVATFPGTTAGGSETRIVARQVTVVAATAPGEGLNGGRVTLTIAVADLEEAQAVQLAADVAQIAVVRGVDPAAPTPTAPATTGGQQEAG